MKETPIHKLRYPEPKDPNTLSPYYENLAKDTERELDAIGLSQLVVPGSSDGKLVIVKDGAAAFKAMSGDGTIDEDGVLQLGSKVVGTSELGDKSVTGAKLDDDSVTSAKIGADQVGSSEIAPGAVGLAEMTALYEAADGTPTNGTAQTQCEIAITEGFYLAVLRAEATEAADGFAWVEGSDAGVLVNGKVAALRSSVQVALASGEPDEVAYVFGLVHCSVASAKLLGRSTTSVGKIRASLTVFGWPGAVGALL